jgi:hypothetical protein
MKHHLKKYASDAGMIFLGFAPTTTSLTNGHQFTKRFAANSVITCDPSLWT